MGRVVALKIKYDNLQQRFTISLQVLRDNGSLVVDIIEGNLPALSDLFSIHQSWYQKYISLIRDPLCGDIIVDQSIATHSDSISDVDACRKSSRALRNNIQNLLENHQDIGWTKIQNKLVSELRDSSDEIRVLIQADDPQVWKLPWHEWRLLQEGSSGRVEVAFSHLNHPYTKSNRVTPQGQVKIVALVDTIQELHETVTKKIASLPEAIPKYPTDLNTLLNELREGCEILIFAGHGRTGDDGTGWIIYGDSQITVEGFANALKVAVSKGLKLVFLCCCDCFGLITDLKNAGVNIPVIIAMREEISVRGAQVFFTKFFDKYAINGHSLYSSFRQAREEGLENSENQLPGTIWIPMIYQILSVKPPTWQELDGSNRILYWFNRLRRSSVRRFVRLFHFPRLNPISLIILFVLLMLVGFVLFITLHRSSKDLSYKTTSVPLCPSHLPANVSFGNKLFTTKVVDKELQSGIQNLNNGCKEFEADHFNNAHNFFSQAYVDLRIAWDNNKTNGEIFTYYNNAKVLQMYAYKHNTDNASTASNKPSTVNTPEFIAVAIPITHTTPEIQESGNEIALGVAIAQKNFNDLNKDKNRGFIVLIADDKSDDEETVKRTVDYFKKNTPNMLGVVGHLFSDLTNRVSAYYNEKQLVLISPTATAVDIRPPAKSDDSNYIFRVPPTDKSTAKKITEHIRQVAPPGKVVIIHADDQYGNSLKQEVEDKLPRFQGWKILTLKINDRRNNELKNASAVVLLPNGQTRKFVLNVVEEAQKERSPLLIGGDSMFNEKTLETPCLDGLMVAAPGYSIKFLQTVNEVLKDKSAKLESWRVPYAYDATKALLEASKSLPASNTEERSSTNSSKVKQELDQLKFEGVTGQISFSKGDRAEGGSMSSQLFKVVNEGNKCSFKRL